jgi:hypothetical protein
MLPALRTRRLFLCPATGADADDLWALWSDPGVRRFLWEHSRNIAQRGRGRRLTAGALQG